MRLCYVLLSATLGMHQYTADLANRMAAEHEVHLVTSIHALQDRYSAEVALHTPVANRDTGFSAKGIVSAPAAVRHLSVLVGDLNPDIVHFTGPHLWNPMLLHLLRRSGLPTVHTLHDLQPHAGARYGRLLYAWNAWVRHSADHILVHGQRYRRQLVSAGVDRSRIGCTPLTHLFLGYESQQKLQQAQPANAYEPWALFIGRLEAYKGLDVLVDAAQQLGGAGTCLVVAGQGRLEALVQGEIPANVDVRDRFVDDEEAIDLFRRCGLVVLPYVEASQSALVAAAAAFRKPALVTDAGALPEYVSDGKTGWVIPPADAGALAAGLRMALADGERLARMGRAAHMRWTREREAEGRTLRAMYRTLVRG
jgi:glycosyltransferase involved in cell wall biosynthesis